MRNSMILGALALAAMGVIAYAPACTSSNPLAEPDSGAVCVDAGGGQGKGCACDPAKFGKKGCFEAPPSMLKGACKSGMRSCSADGVQSACEGQILPSPETCNGLDDDCNGVIDDISSNEPVITDFTDAGLDPPIEAGAQCYVNGQTGLCAAGRYGCNSMGMKDCLSIVAKDPDSGLSPYTEICNGIDDDCDGTEDNVDWAGQKCTVTYEDGGGPKGECANGTRQCFGGVESCQGQMPAMNDQCDGKDNDCDGKYDEGPTGMCNNGNCSCAQGQWCCVYSNNVYCAGSNPYGNPYVCYKQP